MGDKKEYLGDGVYVAIDRGMLLLTTEDGVRATNSVYLELEVYDALVRYVRSLRSALPNGPGPKGEP